MKKNLILIALLLTVATVTSCGENLVNDNSGKTGGELQEEESGTISYERCTHEGEYMDTISVEGTGYLFIDSIPAGLQKDNNVMYIIYNKEDNLTAFSYSGTYESSSAFYNGNICNLPDFAKELEIPFEGKQIHYKGNMYISGMYLSIPPHIGGDLILTTFK